MFNYDLLGKYISCNIFENLLENGRTSIFDPKLNS